MTPPRMTIVVLTLDEAHHVGGCLDALAAQEDHRFEVLVVDAASRDRTLQVVEAHRDGLPVPLRVAALSRRLPIGEARNLGVHRSHAPAVAFVSADARPDPGWTAAALAALEDADLAFGPQIHAPRRWTTATAVRGLRYRFPRRPVADPRPHASNVAAAYRREVLEALPFDPDASACEDLLLAHRAARRGYALVYDPAMTVRHLDVSTPRGELRKNLREGRARGASVGELGQEALVLAWAAALAFTGALAAAVPPAGLPLLLLTLYAPALRRAARHRDLPVGALLRGILATPPFDLAYLLAYLRGLLDPPQAHPDDPLEADA